MFNFTVSSDIFNSFLGRLISISGGNRDSVITFNLDAKGLKLYYNSSTDGSDSVNLLYEEVPTLSVKGGGCESLKLSSLLSIKVPEFSAETKFPYCKEINFVVTKSLLKVSYSTTWNTYSNPNITSLNFPLLGSSESLNRYDKMFNDQHNNEFTIKASELSKAITLCNFIKIDATSKDNNGCLIKVLGNAPPGESDFMLVSTDSNTALTYKTVTENKDLSTSFDMVIDNKILNGIRSFLPDEGLVRISKKRNQMYLETENRRMLVASRGSEYIIDDPEDFFTVKDEQIAELELKPTISMSNTLVSKSNHVAKKLTLTFFDNYLNLESSEDITKNIPCLVDKEKTIAVNGSYLVAACQRMLSLGLGAFIYYDDDSHKITLQSEEKNLIYLIQGL